MLTARDAVENRVQGLDAGADDYLVKPFSLDELLARLRAVVRRTRGAAARVIEVDDLQVDTAARTVHRGGKEIPLSAREYRVLECLALNRGRIVSRDRLVEHAYDGEEEPESNVIDVYIGHLRRKIDRGHDQRLIQTRRGLGYILEVSA
jgi:DNA-binding response OmpR family regulator